MVWEHRLPIYFLINESDYIFSVLAKLDVLSWNKKNLSLKLDVIGLSELRCGNRQDIHLKHCMGLKIKPLFRRTNNSWLHKMTAEKRCALFFDYFVMSKFQGQPSY